MLADPHPQVQRFELKFDKELLLEAMDCLFVQFRSMYQIPFLSSIERSGSMKRIKTKITNISQDSTATSRSSPFASFVSAKTKKLNTMAFKWFCGFGVRVSI